MPELPEVETTRRGLAPFLVGARVQSVVVRDRRLRWPVPSELETAMEAQIITAVHRRAKYLLWQTQAGTCLVHLGMSGSLRLVKHTDELHTHDHVIWRLPKGQEVRLRDPRRFGAVLWVEGDPADHKLLRHLGPEPLGNGFHADWLYRRSRGRRIAIKSFIMGAAE
ncbi:MAG: DNA-formamidopyrimidine glycosylase, partial [Chromatiales bacterium]|nr:DNA-formamidopyrimidine glycosylase [Chromatiales bacterium]